MSDPNTPAKRRLTNAADLKALAHPLRMQLLGTLVTDGPRTASQLAEIVGESPSNCSWHLRKLAEHGFVTEVPDTPGRSRPWQAVSQGLVWGEDDADAETRLAGDALTDALLDHELDRLRAARAEQDDETADWRKATTVTQSRLWLTAEEATEISETLTNLLLTHSERHQDPSLRPAGARLVSLVGWLVPARPPVREEES